MEVVKVKDVITEYHFVYDANDQLTKETLPDGTVNTYDYDAVGNRTASEVNGEKATFTYNDANQIAMKNETAYTYDKDGNLLQDEHYKYTYSDQQRLTRVTTLDDQIIASYTYDENGLRLTKTVGDKTHEYFYIDEVLDKKEHRLSTARPVRTSIRMEIIQKEYYIR